MSIVALTILIHVLYKNINVKMCSISLVKPCLFVLENEKKKEITKVCKIFKLGD